MSRSPILRVKALREQRAERAAQAARAEVLRAVARLERARTLVGSLQALHGSHLEALGRTAGAHEMVARERAAAGTAQLLHQAAAGCRRLQRALQEARNRHARLTAEWRAATEAHRQAREFLRAQARRALALREEGLEEENSEQHSLGLTVMARRAAGAAGTGGRA